MIAVNAPTIDRINPTVAIRLFSERLPKTPKTTPAIPKIVPNAGTKPVQKLKTPNPADSRA